jgi:hypothetical protein
MREQGTGRCELSRASQWVECLIIIDAGTLREPTKNPSGFVPLKCTTNLKLVFKDPLAGDNIGDVVARNQVPSVVGHERRTLPPYWTANEDQ